MDRSQGCFYDGRVMRRRLTRRSERQRCLVKIGILKTDAVRPEWVPEFGEYPDMFIALLGELDPTLEFSVYDVEQGEYPADIDEVDAYLITGSKSSVYEDKPWIARLIDFVRELHRRGKKLVGICFGHQLVAQALGGKTEKSAKGWGVGRHTHRFIKLPSWHDQGEPEFDVLVSPSSSPDIRASCWNFDASSWARIPMPAVSHPSAVPRSGSVWLGGSWPSCGRTPHRPDRTSQRDRSIVRQGGWSVVAGTALHRVQVIIQLPVVGEHRHIRERLENLEDLVDVRLAVCRGEPPALSRRMLRGLENHP
jgi:GMP synthase-like glutamine amidotransferase